MNKVSSKKSVLRTKPKKEKRGQKRRYEKETFGPCSNKPKRMKRARQKSRKSSRFLNEYAEYESSRMDLGRSHQHHQHQQQIQRIPSDNSVIYVKTYPQRDSIPVIDLTRSSHSILYNTVSSKFPSNTSLKLIYKSNNFNNRLQKHLASSLLTMPMRRNFIEKNRNNSVSNLTQCSREKLSILDVPPEFFDEDTDGSEYAFHDLSKADLNEEDRSMVECIAMKEDGNNSAYSLESKQPIENMCKLYGVTSQDGFD